MKLVSMLTENKNKNKTNPPVMSRYVSFLLYVVY